MRDDECVRDVYEHVERFPPRVTECGEPEIVGGCGHHREDEQGKEAEELEWDAARWCVEHGENWVLGSESAIKTECKKGVEQRDNEKGNPEVTPIVQERRSERGDASERPDDHDDVQHENGTDTECADQEYGQ